MEAVVSITTEGSKSNKRVAIWLVTTTSNAGWLALFRSYAVGTSGLTLNQQIVGSIPTSGALLYNRRSLFSPSTIGSCIAL